MMKNLPLVFAFATLSLLAGCSSPPETTIEVTALLQAAPNVAFGQIAATAAGDGGAIAYAEFEKSTDGNLVQKTRIMLQRLDSAGATQGSAIELGINPPDAPARVTLASDGIRYIACWGGYGDDIACATAPVAEGNATPALSINGHWPSIAHGSAGWALAYGLPGQLAILHLADDGTAVGDPVFLEGNSDGNSETLLAPTEAGFVLAGHLGESIHVFWLDSDFARVGTPIDLGTSFWIDAAMAVSGTNVAVSARKPYGRSIFVVDGTTMQDQYEFDIGLQPGVNAVVGADGSSFGVFSADANAALQYGLIDEGGSTLPSEGVLKVYKSCFEGSLAIVKLKEDTFVAATTGVYQIAGNIIIAQVRRLPVQ